ncbi:recombinase family protein [Comamonas avium]|uniref:Recombinase family protein n=1 Tax=Comamonas avium TaxID=2762231 RepID=A0ABR8SCN6_9BURK|nr:recombinase family protein [Comamonas avium]MBD7961238.1 recombinase family protein [Comamonas avium]
MAIYGYARVSTREQETYLQIDALRSAGALEIRQEKCSSVGERPELRRLLSELRSGDVLLVYKMDRVARSLKDLLNILDQLTLAGAAIRSLTEPLDTSGPIGIFMVQVLGAVAQLERSIIRERSVAGQIAAYKRGVPLGRHKHATPPDVVDLMRADRATGLYTWAALGVKYGKHASTVKRLVSGKTCRSVMPVLGKYLDDPPDCK